MPPQRRQARSDHILANASSGDLSPLYLEVLGSLGWPVSVSAHPGWTGDVATSWRPADTSPQSTEAAPGPARYNGDTALLYWADVCGELAILVPSTSGQTADLRPSSAQGAAFLMSGLQARATELEVESWRAAFGPVHGCCPVSRRVDR